MKLDARTKSDSNEHYNYEEFLGLFDNSDKGIEIQCENESPSI